MERSSRQQVHIEAAPEAIWDLGGDPNRHPAWWPDVIEVECADLREGCRYRGVIKGFIRADEHAAVSGRRIMRSWLEQSLANLKLVAEGAPAPS